MCMVLATAPLMLSILFVSSHDNLVVGLSIMSKVEVVLTKGDRVFDFIAVIEKPENSASSSEEKEKEVITLD